MIPFCILVIEDDDDRAFMTELFLNYQRLLYREIYTIVRNEWDTEDIMQATLEKLIDKISLLRSKARDQMVNYVITTAKNTALNFIRVRKLSDVFSFDDCWDAPDESKDGHVIEAHLMEEEDAARFARIWPKLDERSRYLLEVRYILEKSDSELAQDLHIKPESVRMALTRARKKALRLLKGKIEV